MANLDGVNLPIPIGKKQYQRLTKFRPKKRLTKKKAVSEEFFFTWCQRIFVLTKSWTCFFLSCKIVNLTNGVKKAFGFFWYNKDKLKGSTKIKDKGKGFWICFLVRNSSWKYFSGIIYFFLFFLMQFTSFYYFITIHSSI